MEFLVRKSTTTISLYISIEDSETKKAVKEQERSFCSQKLPVSTSTYESIKIDDFKYSTRRMPTRNDLRSELKKLPSHAEAEFIIPSENPHPFRGDNQNP
jgi:hypothetical protein